jgi:hypothetical protein
MTWDRSAMNRGHWSPGSNMTFAEQLLISLSTVGRCCLYYLSMALQSPWTLAIYTQSVGLLGRGDQPVASLLTTHRINSRRHLCLEWDSNPRSQCSSGRRRFMPQTKRPLWSAWYLYCRTKIRSTTLRYHRPSILSEYINKFCSLSE